MPDRCFCAARFPLPPASVARSVKPTFSQSTTIARASRRFTKKKLRHVAYHPTDWPKSDKPIGRVKRLLVLHTLRDIGFGYLLGFLQGRVNANFLTAIVPIHQPPRTSAFAVLELVDFVYHVG